MTPDEVLIPAAISSWEQVVTRVGTLCLSRTEEQLLVEVAPGKNRIMYLWGHLTAIHDAMFSVLRLGERLHPELDAIFIAQPDRSMPLPTSAEIANCWEGVHTELFSRFTTLSPNEWLERHGNVSAEEFERNPTRNRLAVLLNRTNHASYHFGQMMLAKPKTPWVAFATLLLRNKMIGPSRLAAWDREIRAITNCERLALDS